MKKGIAVLAGIAVMFMVLFAFVGRIPVMASTQSECKEAGYSYYRGWCYSSTFTATGGTSAAREAWASKCEGEVKNSGDKYYCVIDVRTHGSYGSDSGTATSPTGNGYDTVDGGNNSENSSAASGGDYGNVDGTSSGITGNTSNAGAASDNGCGGDGVKTNLFGDGCVSGTDGIFMVLNVILNVLTWGIGIAGTLGIVITGIQYMTAKDNATQMEKAKNRLIQIIIGLVIYAVMWAFLQWLLPGGIFGN